MLWMHKPAYPSKSSTLHMFTDFQLPARPGSDSRSENLRPRHPCGKTQKGFRRQLQDLGWKWRGWVFGTCLHFFGRKGCILFSKSCSGSMHEFLLNTVFGSGVWLCWGIPAPAPAQSSSSSSSSPPSSSSSSSWLTAGAMDGCEGWMDQWSSGALQICLLPTSCHISAQIMVRKPGTKPVVQ